MKTRRDYKGNIWRHLLADAIEANDGYCRGYRDKAALSWNVGVYESVPDFKQMLLDSTTKKGDYCIGPDAELDEGLLAQLQKEWDDDEHQSQVFYWAIEDMQRDVTDADCYMFLRPEVEKRYGLNQGSSGYDVTWEFMGRQGKHLCLTAFEGENLKVSARELAEYVRDGTAGNYSNKWCLKLLAFIHESDICFTREMVESEFEHQVRFMFYQELEEIEEKTKRMRKEAAERLWWAERDGVTK